MYSTAWKSQNPFSERLGSVETVKITVAANFVMTVKEDDKLHRTSEEVSENSENTSVH